MTTESVPSGSSTPAEIKGDKIPLEEAVKLLASERKAIIACGTAFVGEEGYNVTVANILQMAKDQQTLLGWAYQHRLGPYPPDEYEHEGFHRLEGKTAGHARLPDTFFCWISEIDESVILEENEKRAREILDWALSLGYDTPRPGLLS